MTGEGGARAVIQEQLAHLEAEYGSITVNQTNFEVEPAQYRQAREEAAGGTVDVHVIVRNETDDVLLREDDGEWVIPQGTTRPGEAPADAARRILREKAPVQASVDGVANATITGISSTEADGEETAYRLSVVFTAEMQDAAAAVDPADATGTDAPAVRWDADPPAAGTEFS